LLKSTQDLQTKIDGFEKKTQSIEEKESVKQAETVLTKALDGISKSLKFDDDDDKGDWKKAVLTYLVNNPKKYASEQEFLDTIQSVSKAEHEALVKRNERITARYVKSKGSGPTVPTHPAGSGAKPLSKKPSMGGKGEEDNLQDVLEEALKDEQGNTT